MKLKDWFADFARGAALGLGILPGVSVGTVGIIVHVYDKLINSIDGLRHKFWQSFKTLLPLGIGCIISAILLLLFWQKIARPFIPFITISVLAGAVLGSVPMICSQIKSRVNWSLILRVLGGFIIAAAIGIVSFLSAKFNWNIWNFQSAFLNPFQFWWIFLIVFVVGFVAAIACLIPGISGSMVLFIFGLYNPVIGIFISQRDNEGNVIYPSIFRDQSRLGSGILLIIVLLVGILLGFFVISKTMKVLLEKHKTATFEIVLGFILGSVVSMFVNNDMYNAYFNPNTSQWWQFVLGGILLVGVTIISWWLINREEKRSSSE